MGCAETKALREREKCQPIDFYVTPEEKELLRKSWAVISPDVPSVGVFIFQRLFDLEFDLRKVFKRLLMKNDSGQFLIDQIRLESHAVSVLKRIGFVIQNLDNSIMLTTTLVALGETHADYKVHPDMLPLLWTPIRDGVKFALGDDYSLSVELAWKHLFDFIACNLSEGMTIAYTKDNRISFLSSDFEEMATPAASPAVPSSPNVPVSPAIPASPSVAPENQARGTEKTEERKDREKNDTVTLQTETSNQVSAPTKEP